MKNFGPMAFLAGLVLSVLLGLINIGPMGLYALTLLGAIVGFLNIQKDEVITYLVSIVALMVSANTFTTLFQPIPTLGTLVVGVVGALTAFLAAGAAIVSLKTLLELAKD